MNRIYFSLVACGLSLLSPLEAIQSPKEIAFEANKGLVAKNYGPGSNAPSSWLQYKLTRTALGIGVHGTTITMDDQTIWEVAPGSTYTAKMWGAGASFIIYPNSAHIGRGSSQYQYILYNESSGSWVEARLSEGPFVKYAVLTHDIDFHNGYIYLSDGSIWKINPTSYNFSQLRSWQERQAILVGRNTGWFIPNQLLINVNENNSVSADFYGFQ